MSNRNYQGDPPTTEKKRKIHVVDALERMTAATKCFIEIYNPAEKERKVFLGGTCDDSTWRNELIPLLEEKGIPYFNPVVDEWNDEAQAEENRQKEICGIELYYITKEMSGVFSIAEVIDAVHKNPYGTIFCVDFDGFDKHQVKSLQAVGQIVLDRGGYYMGNMSSIIETLENPLFFKGFPPKVTFTVQSAPISEIGGMNGVQAADIIEFSKCLIESLNDRFFCRENSLTITKLDEAIHWQDHRTKDRERRKVEGQNKV